MVLAYFGSSVVLCWAVMLLGTFALVVAAALAETVARRLAEARPSVGSRSAAATLRTVAQVLTVIFAAVVVVSAGCAALAVLR
jgi:hypothetical protein